MTPMTGCIGGGDRNKDANTNDALRSAGDISYGGTLSLENLSGTPVLTIPAAMPSERVTVSSLGPRPRLLIGPCARAAGGAARWPAGLAQKGLPAAPGQRPQSRTNVQWSSGLCHVTISVQKFCTYEFMQPAE